MASQAEIQQVAEALCAGKPAIFPTDTVYGLGVSVKHASSPTILYKLKQRSDSKPIAWLVSGVGDLTTYGKNVPALALRAAQTYWPGPLTIIVKASNAVPAAFRSDAGTIGLRMPNNPTVLELIARVGGPLAATSANLSGEDSAFVFDQISPNIMVKVDAAMGDNLEKSGIASTILDCTADEPKVLREGAISAAALQALE